MSIHTYDNGRCRSIWVVGPAQRWWHSPWRLADSRLSTGFRRRDADGLRCNRLILRLAALILMGARCAFIGRTVGGCFRGRRRIVTWWISDALRTWYFGLLNGGRCLSFVNLSIMYDRMRRYGVMIAKHGCRIITGDPSWVATLWWRRNANSLRCFGKNTIVGKLHAIVSSLRAYRDINYAIIMHVIAYMHPV